MNVKNQILGNLLRKPLESKSMHQIALDTKLTYVTVHKNIPKLLREGLVRSDKKGKSNLISIDFEKASIGNLSSSIIYERERFVKKYPKLAILIKDIEKALSGKLYLLILFGSYAQEKAKKDSDLDLLLIVQKREDIVDYRKIINTALSMSTLRKDLNVITTDDFVDMLNQRYSVGREAFENGIVFFGTESYYVMVKEHVKKRGY